MLITKTNIEFMSASYKAAFQVGLKNNDFFWSRFTTEIMSSALIENYAFLEQWPRLREWIGDKHIKDLSDATYTLRNKDYEATVAVPRNALDDNQYGLYAPMMTEMGYAANEFVEHLVMTALLAGDSSVCYDGQYFFDTDHPVGGGTNANKIEGAGDKWFLMDTRRAIKPMIFQNRKSATFVQKTSPTDDNVFFQKQFIYGVEMRANVGYSLWQLAYQSQATLNGTNFDTAVKNMMLFKSAEGRPLNIRPNVLIVGPSNRAAARALLEAEKESGGGTNVNYKAVDLIVTPYLP